MSWKSYEEDCPGCRPCLINAETGQPMGQDTPIMKQVNAIWEKATLHEKRAFHNVMCNNSRDAREMALATGLAKKFEVACQSN